LANIINGTDTGSGGLITTGDSSDELQLQTAETTAITITSGQQSAFIAGTAAAPAVTTTGDLNTGIFFPAGDAVGVATNGAEAARFNSSGNLVFPNGQGIDFSASAGGGASSSLLDDYEEGTWTPVIGGSGGESGQSYTNQIGLYTKVGKIVTASFLCILSAKGTITGDVRIKGLPFTADATANQRGAGTVGVFFNFATNINWIGLVTTENATAANVIYTAAAAANISDATTTQIGNSTRLDGTIVYIANA
jgi:hypothetical protein